MDSSTQKLKDMIQRMTELDTPEQKKKQLDEMASMNISMSGDSAEDVASLMKIMQNAGMNDAAPVQQDQMPVRQDMERLSGIVGDAPMESEESCQCCGEMHEGACTDDGPHECSCDGKMHEKGHNEELEEYSDQDADTLRMLHGLVQSAAYRGIDSSASAQFQDYVDNNFPHVDSEKLIAKLISMDDNAQFEALHDMLNSEYRNDSEDDYGKQSQKAGELAATKFSRSSVGEDDVENSQYESGYDNAPDEDYQDSEYMTKDLSGGLNRQKKAYKKAQDGDNAMAVESIKDRLYAALSEKKAKPDYADIDGDGDKKEPMKKAAKDKKDSKKKVSEGIHNAPRKKVIQALRSKFKLNAVPGEEFDESSKGSIWIKDDISKPETDYYPYADGTMDDSNVLNRFLTKAGWAAEPYDSETIIIHPA